MLPWLPLPNLGTRSAGWEMQDGRDPCNLPSPPQTC